MDKLSEIVNSRIYKSITANVCKNHHLRHDLHSEAILVLVEKKYDLESNTNLLKFFATIVWLTWRSNKFRKKYFTGMESLDVLTEDEEKEDFDNNLNITEVSKMLNDDYKNDFDYYEKNLLKMYVKLGDCRAVSKQTNIPYRTVANDIKTIKDNLKKAHNEENSN